MLYNNLLRREEENRYRTFLVFFIIYCFGKSYYVIFGWHGHLIPDAPLAVILVKDFLLIGFTIYAFLAYSDIRPDFKEKFMRYYASFCLFLLLIAFMHFFNLGLADWGHFYIRNSFMPLVFIYFGYKLIPENRYLHFFNAFLAYAVFCAVVAITSYYYYFEILHTTGEPFFFSGRAISLTDNPNTLGGITAIGILIAVSRIFNRTGNVYILCSSLVILAAGLFLSQSITNIFVMTGLILLLVFVHIKKRIYREVFIVFFCIVVGSFFPNNFYTTTSKRFDETIDPQAKHTIYARKEQYAGIPDYFRKSDLKDILFGNFKTSKFYTYDSTFITVFYNFGIIILFMVFAFMVYLLYFAFVFRRKAETEYDKMVLEILYLIMILFVAVSIARDLFHRFPLNNFYYVEAGMLARYIKH